VFYPYAPSRPRLRANNNSPVTFTYYSPKSRFPTASRASPSSSSLPDSLNSPLTDVLPRVGALQLATLLAQAGVAADLSGEEEFTIFAPSDAALERFLLQQTASVRDALTDRSGDQNALRDLLLNHVVKGRVLSKDLAPGEEVINAVDGVDHERCDEGGELGRRIASSGEIWRRQDAHRRRCPLGRPHRLRNVQRNHSPGEKSDEKGRPSC